MYYQFLKYISDQQLFTKDDHLLVGVSGGADSVVLIHMLEKAGYQIAIAHCNFNLRADESDQDQSFVNLLAESLGLKCFVNSFNTVEFATNKGISIEMAARELRYQWFEQLCNEKNFTRIVVGHHLDDVLETFMLNLSRGTGIRGLSGIKPLTGRVARPLLFASRSEIIAYATENKLLYRTDSSNSDVTIKRNKVRHLIMPLFEELNPAFKRNLQRTIHYLHQTETVFIEHVQQVIKSIAETHDHYIKYPISKITKLDPLKLWLFEFFREFGFKAEMVNDIILALEKPSGQQFFSSTHRLVVDRFDLILTEIENKQWPDLFYIDSPNDSIIRPFGLKISTEPYTKSFQIPKNSNISVFDFDTMIFPLVIRRWHRGEYFRPLGMEGFKKLSDFFIDEKYSIPEKENVWILASDNKVVWIIGKRIDDRFKITPNTKTVLRIEKFE